MYSHDFRQEEKKKFMTTGGFTMNGYKSVGNPFWKEITNGNEPGASPYLGGL
jgi:hypothetical protein